MNLEEENKALRKIIENTLWMAKRYSEGKETCCTSKTIEEALESSKSLGINSEIKNELCFSEEKKKNSLGIKFKSEF